MVFQERKKGSEGRADYISEKLGVTGSNKVI